MHFELLITGKIPNGKGNKNLEHRTALRMQVHDQLERVWQNKPLKDRMDLQAGPHRAAKYDKEFVFLASYKGNSACKLKVVFYEPSGSLEVASQVADADNRVAGLLDLLSVPVGPAAAAALPGFNFVLLQDDSLVWSIEIERKRLFRAIEGTETFTRVEVRVMPTAATWSNIALIDIPSH